MIQHHGPHAVEKDLWDLDSRALYVGKLKFCTERRSDLFKFIYSSKYIHEWISSTNTSISSPLYVGNYASYWWYNNEYERVWVSRVLYSQVRETDNKQETNVYHVNGPTERTRRLWQQLQSLLVQLLGKGWGSLSVLLWNSLPSHLGGVWWGL